MRSGRVSPSPRLMATSSELEQALRTAATAHDGEQLVGHLVRQHGAPARVAALEERAPARHRDEAPVGLRAVGARPPGNVARQLVIEAAEDFAIVVAAPLEAEERPVLGGRDKIKRAVEARIVGLGDINLG